ncbi:hypothetical protein PGT21_008388 [Puccinia graminis f. sp. tritici]|uniref:Uncharacterized protein n=2 Tax=Puccinia graminis f. sp. tritici TaxID=56615 RepID=A0A5B0RGQ9_PUCGR|nr:hypothetical protein PGT21_008388 [Puccinia graminis f. sp. tritici]KAA1124927.1 hypothetical protein PGTUg99_036792 [Puccinia graminis f. sp. tritici]
MISFLGLIILLGACLWHIESRPTNTVNYKPPPKNQPAPAGKPNSSHVDVCSFDPGLPSCSQGF